MRLALRIFLTLLLSACGSSTSGTSNPNDGDDDDDDTSNSTSAAEQTCSFRVTGATVDKVNESKTVASMNGSSLYLNCQVSSASGTKIVLDATLKAFDGAGEYKLDGTDAFGELTYHGNDDAQYFAHAFDSGGKGTSPTCVFAFSEAPKDPKKGDTLTATFHCEALQSLGAELDVARVDVVDGTFAATVD